MPDTEALPYIYDILNYEGLSVGLSSGINIAAAVRVAKELDRADVIVNNPGGWWFTGPVEALQSHLFALERGCRFPHGCQHRELVIVTQESCCLSDGWNQYVCTMLTDCL